MLGWGDLGSQWGVNRSVSQVHALLYVSASPLTAESIAETLQMARSNVSNSLKELLAWNLIRRVPVRGDRRDHFEAETDPWEMAARIAAGRKAREFDPALAALRASTRLAATDPSVGDTARRRLADMLTFTEAVDHWYRQMLAVPPAKRTLLMKLGAKVFSFLPGGKAKP